jgi:hypothetical protein
MTRVILIDPESELIIHSIPIETRESACRCENLQKDLETARGHELERVIVSMHTVRIMDRNDPIPIPLMSTRLERT